MFLNSIPVIGHVKGVVHYVKGEKEKGRRAICEATRTTVVIGGGVVGAVAGPAGAAFVAAAGGALLDSVASIATKEPLGLCGNINHIVTDVRNGKPPLAAALEAGITVGTDLLMGVSSGALASGTSKAAGSSTGKRITKTIGKALKKSFTKKSVKKEISKTALTVGAAVAEAAVMQIQALSPQHSPVSTATVGDLPINNDLNRCDSRTSLNRSSRRIVCDYTNESKMDQSTDELYCGFQKDSSRSGYYQSPSGNNSKIKKRYSLKMTKSFEVFGKTIRGESLKDICIEGDYIFKELGYDEQRSFSARVQNLKRQGYDANRVTKITTELFKNIHGPGEGVDYKNFLIEMDFVATYIGERVDRLNDLRNDNGDNLRGIIDDQLSADDRLRQLADAITTNLLSPKAVPLLEDVTIDNIVSTFRTIQSQITGVVIRPDFENVYSAVYNYYTNRYISEQNRVLSVSEYFEMIRFILSEIIETQDYERLCKREISDMQIDIQFGGVGKADVVLSNECGKVIISSILFSY